MKTLEALLVSNILKSRDKISAKYWTRMARIVHNHSEIQRVFTPSFYKKTKYNGFSNNQ